MKKLLLIGHSKGLGLAITELFRKRDWLVEGRSRSNNFDLNQSNVREKICRESTSFDLIINNARSGFSQTLFLSDIFDHWKSIHHQGLIINIGSIGAYTYNTRSNIKDPYYFEKMSLIKMSESIALNQNEIRSVVINPGYMATDRIKNKNLDGPLLSPDYVAEIIFFVANQPANILIPELKIIPWSTT